MDTLCLILAIIGAVNWGLVGFARFDLVAWIFGGQTAGVSRVIYADCRHRGALVHHDALPEAQPPGGIRLHVCVSHHENPQLLMHEAFAHPFRLPRRGAELAHFLICYAFA